MKKWAFLMSSSSRLLEELHFYLDKIDIEIDNVRTRLHAIDRRAEILENQTSQLQALVAALSREIVILKNPVGTSDAFDTAQPAIIQSDYRKLKDNIEASVRAHRGAKIIRDVAAVFQSVTGVSLGNGEGFDQYVRDLQFDKRTLIKLEARWKELEGKLEQACNIITLDFQSSAKDHILVFPGLLHNAGTHPVILEPPLFSEGLS